MKAAVRILPSSIDYSLCIFKPRQSTNFIFNVGNQLQKSNSIQQRFFADSTVDLVKELRRRTSAGYMDCKKALTESNNDIDKAIEWLRKKGQLKAATKADRVTTEGSVAVAKVPDQHSIGIMVELNSETDFVSRGESFMNLVHNVTKATLSHIKPTTSSSDISIDEIKKLTYPNSSQTVDEAIKETIGKLGENIQLRRAHVLYMKPGSGVVCGYSHRTQGTAKDGVSLGHMGSLVALESPSTDTKALLDLGNKLATHIVGYSPKYVSKDEVEKQVVDTLKAQIVKKHKEDPVTKDQPLDESRLNDRIISDIVLLEQPFYLSNDKLIKEVIAERAKALNTTIKVKAFHKFICGEGIEKKEQDFAQEVQKLAGTK